MPLLLQSLSDGLVAKKESLTLFRQEFLAPPHVKDERKRVKSSIDGDDMEESKRRPKIIIIIIII